MDNLTYDWSFENHEFSKKNNDKNVFSCFSGGGGSSMGYKLAGFNVIGYNEIDKRMAEEYDLNMEVKYKYVEPIQDFANRDEYPRDLYNLAILDGSPPCSSFSTIGVRDRDWGKMKKFKEGQAEQILDDLFFYFIKLAKKLRPKVVIAENVKGLLIGSAKTYLYKIYEDFNNAGYTVSHFLLNGKNMGLPQSRERVFFIAIRNDIAIKMPQNNDLFDTKPAIKFNFKEKEINFSEIEEKNANTGLINVYPSLLDCYNYTEPGCELVTRRGVKKIGNYRLHRDMVLKTIIAGSGQMLHYSKLRDLTALEMLRASSFPADYKYTGKKIKYLVGMSVPPLMLAKLVLSLLEQLPNLLE